MKAPVLAVSLALSAFATTPATADEKTDRGGYLVQFSGCFDCHTPGYFFGKPDMARFLGGSEVGFEIPEMGVFYAPNLTPDPETGLGKWSEAEIVTALHTGKVPDGRELPPIMPDGTPRTQLIVRDHRTSSRPPGLSVSQELLRTIRDRAERQPDGTFTAA